MEYARDLADTMVAQGKGRVLGQFANADNPRIHYETAGPEIWEQTGGRITHFVSAMGTTGTITGVSRYLKEKNPAVHIIGAQPQEGSRAFLAFASGPRPTNPKSTNPSVWTSWCLSVKTTPKTCAAAWHGKRAFLRVFRQQGPAGWRCKLPPAWKTPPLPSWCVIGAIATCPRVCFLL